ncbi:MAG TPA: hypothetical protein VL241_08180 [Gemmatimonadales bacterium]|nr:hypothetical protein [Gemmatimonadales bacterium]
MRARWCCPALLTALGVAGCATAARRVTILYTSVVAEVSPKEAIIQLDRSFLERYKDRVTITASFTVDNTMEKPNPHLLDGDLHIAGRAPEIGLRLVAEILNADSAFRAMAVVQRAESTHVAVPMTGVWRLWPEHALIPEQQGNAVPVLTTPNPDHIFELHPVTRVGGVGVQQTFHPVEGYRPGNAKHTFAIYEEATCELTVHPERVTLKLSNWLYNDVHFLLEVGRQRPLVVSDGRFVTGSALDTDGNLLVAGLRLVLVAGTAPERAIRALAPGSRVHVWGLPRVSFAELSRRIAQSAADPAVLKGKLPYEIVVLGVYPKEL